MAPPNRKGGGLSARTLAIASLASATAATVTSHFFPPGTIYASALTPVIVAAVNELVNRPADRVRALREQRRTLVLEERERRVAHVLGEEPSQLRGAPEFAQGAEGFDDEAAVAAAANGHGARRDPLDGVRIHGRRRRRVLHPKVWVVTGLLAFAIAVAVLTLPELLFGGAIATNHRTTIFGGGGGHATTTSPQKTPTSSATHTVTVPAPAASGSNTTTSPSSTQTTTGTTTTNGGAAAPAPTGTSTTPTTPTP